MEVVKIEQGKYYRRRDGELIGPAKPRNEPHTSYPWNVGGCFYTGDGLFQVSGPDQVYDLVAETVCTDVLPFELKAGEKYETVKPDGTPGEVVTLADAGFGSYLQNRAYPFSCQAGRTYVTPNGEGRNYVNGVTCLRITAPYVAPPPTTSERLAEVLAAWNKTLTPLSCVAEHKALITKAEGILADLKAQEAA
jgi:hypothetical protein